MIYQIGDNSVCVVQYSDCKLLQKYLFSYANVYSAWFCIVYIGMFFACYLYVLFYVVVVHYMLRHKIVLRNSLM